MISEKEAQVTWEQRLLDLIGMLLRGFGWGVNQGGIAIRLFGFSPMLWELVLAVVFLAAYHFPSEDTRRLIAFSGTELAIPFVLGLFYSVLNMIWVARCRGRDIGRVWYYFLFKASAFPAGLAWAVFSNRSFQQLIGWGNPAATFRSCLFLVWGVVVANVVAANLNQRASQR